MKLRFIILLSKKFSNFYSQESRHQKALYRGKAKVNQKQVRKAQKSA